MLKFLQRGVMSVLLEKIDDSAADDAVNELKHLCRLFLAVGDEVKVVRHNDVGEDEKSARCSSFGKRVARY